jgi:ATP-dependent DNA ligase
MLLRRRGHITDFDRLMARVYDASAYAYAFDLLMLDGDDMRRQPLARLLCKFGA